VIFFTTGKFGKFLVEKFSHLSTNWYLTMFSTIYSGKKLTRGGKNLPKTYH